MNIDNASREEATPKKLASETYDDVMQMAVITLVGLLLCMSLCFSILGELEAPVASADLRETAISSVEKQYQIDDVKFTDVSVLKEDLYASDFSSSSPRLEGSYNGKKIMFTAVLDEETGTARILIIGDGNINVKDLEKGSK